MSVDETKKTLNVLLVDDDKDFTDSLAKVLEKEGFTVTSRYNGKEAFEVFEERAFDVAIIDVLLPGLDGFRMVEEIRWLPHGKETPIIMVSGVMKAATHAKEATGKYGLSAYLEKPVTGVGIIRALREIFQESYPRPAISSEAADPASNQPELSPEYNLAFPNPYFLLRREEMALIGDLDKTPFPLLLAQLYEKKQTGLLLLAHEQVKKVISFERGKPQSVTGNVVRECLGQLLAAAGVITQDQLAQSLETMKKTGMKQGEVLMKMGVINSAQLMDWLRRQVEYKLFVCFKWTLGKYQFKAQQDLPAAFSTLDRHPYALIREGLFTYTPMPLIQQWLRPYAKCDLGLSPEGKAILDQTNFKLKESKFALSLTTSRSLTRLAQSRERSQEETLRLLVSFIMMNITSLRPSEEWAMDLLAERGEPAGQESESLLSAHVRHYMNGGSDEELENLRSSDNGVHHFPERVNRDALKKEYDTAKKTMTEEQWQAYETIWKQREAFRGKTYFEILGVPGDCESKQVKKAYMVLAKQYHPDTFPFNNVPQIRALADEVFTAISRANEICNHEDKKTEYMKLIEGGGDEDATHEVAKILASEKLYDEAEKLLKGNKWTAAFEKLRLASRLNPGDVNTLVKLAWARFNRDPESEQNTEDALKELMQAAKMNEKSDHVYVFAGLIYKAQGKDKQALSAMRKALDLNSNNKQALAEIRALKEKQDGAQGKQQTGFLAKLGFGGKKTDGKK